MSRAVKKQSFIGQFYQTTPTFRDQLLIPLPSLIADTNTPLHRHPEELEDLDEDERQRALRVPNGA